MSARDLLQARKEALEAELSKVEKTLDLAENDYLQAECTQCGTVLKGMEGFLSSKETIRKRQRLHKLEDSLFSLSSCTSPAALELQAQAELIDGTRAPGGLAQKGVSQKAFRR